MGLARERPLAQDSLQNCPVWCLDRVPPRGALVSWRGAAWEVSHSYLRVALVITQGLCHWNSRRTKTSLGSPTVSGFWVS